MSEFIAEAQVLVRPNTALFRAELEKQLLKATAGVVVPVNVVATGTGVAGAAAASQELAATQQEVAIATENAGAASSRAAVARSKEAQVTALAAASAKALALAQTQVEGAASAVAAAQIRNTRSAAAVATAEKEQAAAIALGNKELQIAAAEHLRLAEAEHVNALAALENARAQAAQVATASQVQRAFLAQAATAAGLRGAVLSSTAAFLGATIAAVALGKSVKGASDLNEEINKTVEVFGTSSDAILEWSETTADAIGTSQVEALRAIGTFGELFRTLGVGTPKAAALSKQLVTLGADLASFFNTSNEQALNALQSGLVGQARPLRQFGIFLTEARVKAEALIETGKKNVDNLTQQDRILARYNLILRDSAIASGDFGRTQDHLANQARKLQANMSNLGDEIGNVFLPNIEAAIQDVNKLFFALSKLKNFKAKIVLTITSQIPGGENSTTAKILGFAAGFIGPGGILKANLLGLKAVGKGIDLIGLSGDHAEKKIQDLTGGFGEMDRDARGSAALLDALAASLERAAGAADHLNSRLNIQALTLEAAQAPLAVRIAKQKEIIANDEKLVAQARKTGKAAKIQDALNQQIADQNELESLQNQVLANQREAADKTKEVATKVQEARDKQFQALADMFGGRQANIENAIERAGITGNVEKQRRLTVALIVSLKKERDALVARLKTLKVSNALRKSILDAINRAITDAKNDILRFNQDQAESIKDFATPAIDLRIRIAQARDNVAAEIRLRRQRLALISKELAKLKNAGKKNTLAWLELKAQQAEEAAAIRALEGETKKKSEASSQFFNFLQTQSGFAANLLGNLIPGFATRGLVGNASTAAATPSPSGTFPGALSPEEHGFGPGGGAASAAALASGRDRGVRPMQVDRTNHILHQILLVLQGRNPNPPEIAYNKATGHASYDMF